MQTCLGHSDESARFLARHPEAELCGYDAFPSRGDTAARARGTSRLGHEKWLPPPRLSTGLWVQKGDDRWIARRRVRRAGSSDPRHRDRTGRVDPTPPFVAGETLAACDPKLNLRDRRSIAAH